MAQSLRRAPRRPTKVGPTPPPAALPARSPLALAAPLGLCLAALAASPPCLAQAAGTPDAPAAARPGPGPGPGGARPAAAAASAPAGATPPATGASTAAPQRVEITGRQGQADTEERRAAIASRIVIGREELDRMGDDSLVDVLKRLPGVTVGGAPGQRGGARMRGMGGGYTVILMDGQRMPPGFSLDSIPPEQIERIEVMRAPVAEFSTRAIAGIINIVMRADFRRRVNELNLGLGASGTRLGGRAAWVRNGQADALSWNTTVSAYRSDNDRHSVTSTNGGVDDDGSAIADRLSISDTASRRTGLFATARLQWRLGQGESLELQPFVHANTNRQSSTATRSASTAEATAALPWTTSSGSGREDTSMLRLNGTWNTTTAGGGKLRVRFGGRVSQNDEQSQALQTGGTAAPGGRVQRIEASVRQTNLDSDGKYSLLVGDRHSVSAGWDGELVQRDDQRVETVDNTVQGGAFGDTVQARVQRLALYAQDEWDWSPSLSFYVGGRWEGIRTLSDGAGTGTAVRNTSSVLTPLAHLVWKVPEADGGKPRQQIRASLTRSYKSPDTAQLVGRPRTSSLYPDTTLSNTVDSPDRTGNPDLKPELSWGLELGYERYLQGGGVLAVNGYLKRIDHLIRNWVRLQPADGSTAARYVSRPENIGSADVAGLEFEAKGKAADLLPTILPSALPIDLRANLSLMWSRVSGVPGPDNRIDGQPPWTANLGADWPIKGTPVTVGGNWNYTPGFRLQALDNQVLRESRKSALDAYALWKVSTDLSWRLTLNNILGEDFRSGSTYLNADGTLRQTTDTTSKSTTMVGLRAEVRF